MVVLKLTQFEKLLGTFFELNENDAYQISEIKFKALLSEMYGLGIQAQEQYLKMSKDYGFLENPGAGIFQINYEQVKKEYEKTQEYRRYRNSKFLKGILKAFKKTQKKPKR